ncbi:excalibur calcium-binding domain-containing protein [Mycolicibacterium fortuitum]|uniref:excalibur calcium-binding domain-containing protein n=1 Tax=Mycolicibacterium fortuitum TaxID=1766 RepID=UPI00096CF86C|nr:excalibur calcium-binding domain-containing protein [Mycolicibacterium fortuitum]OMC01264.1 hypothetical protein A5734_17435 [Mycolicibacterium fortuitum]
MTLRLTLAAAALLAGIGIVAAPAALADAPYKNCSQARANGDSNIPSSSDKYGSWLDRDGDGIGCES